MSAAQAGRMPLLQAIDVKKHFIVGNSLLASQHKTVYAVDGVSLEVWPGETLGLVGESGCGKSTLGRCLMRLYEITGGQILLKGTDISRLGLRELRPFRRQMQMVFQDPYASLNPRRRVGDLIAEPLRVHGNPTRAEIDARLKDLMRLVGLEADHLNRFPHEFSGGQRQRIGVARALALEPSLIVADEPVSALDVSIQAQIVNLMADLQERLGLTYIFIAHDLSVVRQVSSRIAVMYLGAIVETGATEEIFRAPAHPYTQALISAVPVPEVDHPSRRERIVLTGDVPSPMNPPTGCRFHPRCRFATQRCKVERPLLEIAGKGRQVACHYPLIEGTAASPRPAA
jgi:peptide/nickel transport system ATP-binding protein